MFFFFSVYFFLSGSSFIDSKVALAADAERKTGWNYIWE
jgi:hypothetical protein